MKSGKHIFDIVIRNAVQAMRAKLALREQLIEKNDPMLGKALAALAYHPDHRAGMRKFMSDARRDLEAYQDIEKRRRLNAQYALCVK